MAIHTFMWLFVAFIPFSYNSQSPTEDCWCSPCYWCSVDAPASAGIVQTPALHGSCMTSQPKDVDLFQCGKELARIQSGEADVAFSRPCEEVLTNTKQSCSFQSILQRPRCHMISKLLATLDSSRMRSKPEQFGISHELEGLIQCGEEMSKVQDKRNVRPKCSAGCAQALQKFRTECITSDPSKHIDHHAYVSSLPALLMLCGTHPVSQTSATSTYSTSTSVDHSLSSTVSHVSTVHHVSTIHHTAYINTGAYVNTIGTIVNPRASCGVAGTTQSCLCVAGTGVQSCDISGSWTVCQCTYVRRGIWSGGDGGGGGRQTPTRPPTRTPSFAVSSPTVKWAGLTFVPTQNNREFSLGLRSAFRPLTCSHLDKDFTMWAKPDGVLEILEMGVQRKTATYESRDRLEVRVSCDGSVEYMKNGVSILKSMTTSPKQFPLKAFGVMCGEGVAVTNVQWRKTSLAKQLFENGQMVEFMHSGWKRKQVGEARKLGQGNKCDLCLNSQEALLPVCGNTPSPTQVPSTNPIFSTQLKVKATPTPEEHKETEVNTTVTFQRDHDLCTTIFVKLAIAGDVQHWSHDKPPYNEWIQFVAELTHASQSAIDLEVTKLTNETECREAQEKLPDWKKRLLKEIGSKGRQKGRAREFWDPFHKKDLPPPKPAGCVYLNTAMTREAGMTLAQKFASDEKHQGFLANPLQSPHVIRVDVSCTMEMKYCVSGTMADYSDSRVAELKSAMAARLGTSVDDFTMTAGTSSSQNALLQLFDAIQAGNGMQTEQVYLTMTFPGASNSTATVIEEMDNGTLIETLGLASVSPSFAPSQSPMNARTISPSVTPTSTPTAVPSATPTDVPSSSPSTPTPTLAPSSVPCPEATISPSVTPTSTPTWAPTVVGAAVGPSGTPTATPTHNPSLAPSRTPTDPPSTAPTIPFPTQLPSAGPSNTPTFEPTQVPTPTPSQSPSLTPLTPSTATPTNATSAPTNATSTPTTLITTASSAPTNATLAPIFPIPPACTGENSSQYHLCDMPAITCIEASLGFETYDLLYQVVQMATDAGYCPKGRYCTIPQLLAWATETGNVLPGPNGTFARCLVGETSSTSDIFSEMEKLSTLGFNSSRVMSQVGALARAAGFCENTTRDAHSESRFSILSGCSNNALQQWANITDTSRSRELRIAASALKCPPQIQSPSLDYLYEHCDCRNVTIRFGVQGTLDSKAYLVHYLVRRALMYFGETEEETEVDVMLEAGNKTECAGMHFNNGVHRGHEGSREEDLGCLWVNVVTPPQVMEKIVKHFVNGTLDLDGIVHEKSSFDSVIKFELCEMGHSHASVERKLPKLRVDLATRLGLALSKLHLQMPPRVGEYGSSVSSSGILLLEVGNSAGQFGEPQSTPAPISQSSAGQLEYKIACTADMSEDLTSSPTSSTVARHTANSSNDVAHQTAAPSQDPRLSEMVTAGQCKPDAAQETMWTFVWGTVLPAVVALITYCTFIGVFAYTNHYTTKEPSAAEELPKGNEGLDVKSSVL